MMTCCRRSGGWRIIFWARANITAAAVGWRIEAPRLSWDILDAVGDAAEEMGIRKIADFNTGDNEGVGYFHVNQKRGRRWSSARGFLKPALKRPNLRLEKDVLVDRLIVEQGRAVGVRFMRGGEVVEARAKGEVILCAGSIGSTQVLHRSGIGPSDWLAPLGIETVLDRQGPSGAICRTICSSARSTRSRACAPSTRPIIRWSGAA